MALLDTNNPEQEAKNLLSTLGINLIPTPLEMICEKLGILLRYSTKIDSAGIFVRDNETKKTYIIIKDDILYFTRKNFSIAHEIGHFCLPGHLNEYRCSFSDLHTYSPNKLAEKQANDFASELLMPSKFFSNDLKKYSLSLSSFGEIALKYNASLTAAAAKYIKKSRDIAAIIWAQDGQIKWTFRSPSFRWTLRSGAIHPNTYAIDFFEQRIELDGKANEVSFDAWIIEKTPFDTLVEETISMPYLNATLSLIYPTVKDYEDDIFLVDDTKEKEDRYETRYKFGLRRR